MSTGRTEDSLERDTSSETCESEEQDKLVEGVLAMLRPHNLHVLEPIAEDDLLPDTSVVAWKRDRDPRSPTSINQDRLPVSSGRWPERVQHRQTLIGPAELLRPSVEPMSQPPASHATEDHPRSAKCSRASTERALAAFKQQNPQMSRFRCCSTTSQDTKSMTLQQDVEKTAVHSMEDLPETVRKGHVTARRAKNLAAALNGRLPPFPAPALGLCAPEIYKRPGSVRAARQGLSERLSEDSRDSSTERRSLDSVCSSRTAAEGSHMVVRTVVRPLGDGPQEFHGIEQCTMHVGGGKSIGERYVAQSKVAQVPAELNKPSQPSSTRPALVRWLTRKHSPKQQELRAQGKPLRPLNRTRRIMMSQREILGGWG